MRLVSRWFRCAVALIVSAAPWTVAVAASAQELPRVSATRGLKIAGLGVERSVEDVLGFARTKFQGVMAAELSSVGYRLVNDGTDNHAGATALTLVGLLKEEICDDQAPSQCRIAILWELQDARGVVVYRTLTRAVDQQPTFEKLRRALLDSSLRSLLQRPRFALQLTDPKIAATKPQPEGPLGFKQCTRASLPLPQGARAVSAALVWVESGSSLQGGSIVSGDGLILTGAVGIESGAPLRVRFSAEQTLPAEVVAINRDADVALVHVAAHTSLTCLPLRDAPLAESSAAFGVSSEPSEDRAISLNGSFVQNSQELGGVVLLRVDPRVARAQGGPLLDEQGRLAGVVSGRWNQGAAGARVVELRAALHALNIRPAAITDPRLVDALDQPTPGVGYVRDKDDPAFVLTRRYTYGTSSAAHRLRTAGMVTAGVGAFGVAATWLIFRASAHPTAAGYNRSVVLNDVSWILLGLGAAGFGASYALPERHDLVAVQSARRELFVGIGAGGLQLSGSL